jgi:hypothetical protein
MTARRAMKNGTRWLVLAGLAACWLRIPAAPPLGAGVRT